MVGTGRSGRGGLGRWLAAGVALGLWIAVLAQAAPLTLDGPLRIGRVQVSSVGASALTAGGTPLAGFQPFMLMRYTSFDSGEIFAVGEPSIFGAQMPSPSNPYTDIGVLDTGAEVMLVRYPTRVALGLEYPQWLTDPSQAIPVGGIGPDSRLADISQPFSSFAGGLQSADWLTGQVNTASFAGASTVSHLVFRQDPPGAPDFPSLVGMPMAWFFTSVIRNDQPVSVPYQGRRYRGPSVQFLPSGSIGISNVMHQIAVEYEGLGWDPFYFPGIDEPFTPTSATRLQVPYVQVKEPGFTLTEDFLIDTGSQGTIISTAVANGLGLNTTYPDFLVQLVGVAGTVTEAPGFWLDELRLPASGPGGAMVFHDVPVVVADVVGADMTTLPGIIGMNLFTDRNLSIDPLAKRIYVSGQVSGPLAGDMNADGLVNGLDVDPFGLALSNPTAYRSLLPGLNPHVLGDINGDGELSELDAGLFSYLLAMGRILRGDMNADGVLNGLDVDPFVLALNDPWLYYGRYGGMDPNYLGDINGDGLLDLYDVDPFVELLMAGGVDPLTIGVITPEPGSAALLGGLMVLAWCGRRGRGVRGRMGSPQGPCT